MVDRSTILLASNGAAGSSLFALLRELCTGRYIVCNAEVDAWGAGDPNDKAYLRAPFVVQQILYMFRAGDQLIRFVDLHNINWSRHRLLVQVRDPADLLLTDFLAKAQYHRAPPGKNREWNRIRRQMIREGPDKLLPQHAKKLDEVYVRIHDIFSAAPNSVFFLSYNKMVCDFRRYLVYLCRSLNINLPEEQFATLCDRHDVRSLIDNADRPAAIRNLQRNRRPEEWPGPGRATFALQPETLNAIYNAAPAATALSRRINDPDLNLGEPPRKSVVFLKRRMWLRYLINFHVKESCVQLGMKMLD